MSEWEDNEPMEKPGNERTMSDDERDLVRENQQLRKLLWLRHGCPTSALYGDDGEMQCNICMLDFKRMSIDEIEGRWVARSERLIRQHLAMKQKGQP